MRYWKSSEYELEFVLSENSEIELGKHNHSSNYVMGLILQGSLRLEVKDQFVDGKPGDIFMIPKDEAHVLSLNGEDSRLLSICIRTTYIEQYDLMIGAKILSMTAEKLVLEKIINQGHVTAFCDALGIIYELYTRKKEVSCDEIAKVQDWMINQPEEDLNLDLLSRKIFISKYDMIRKFKERVGLTPHNFLIQNRIRKAQQLLQQGWKVAEVAVEMGFYDQSHFNKSFRKIVGVSPNEYITSFHQIE